MKYRKLRIAWSVACGIACLLLIALWVRSDTHLDSLHVRVSTNRKIVINSLAGRCEVSLYPSQGEPKRWSYWHLDLSEVDADTLAKLADRNSMFRTGSAFLVLKSSHVFGIVAWYGVILASSSAHCRRIWCVGGCSFQPPHASNRHDADCGGPGLDCLRVEKLIFHQCTVRRPEMIFAKSA